MNEQVAFPALAVAWMVMMAVMMLPSALPMTVVLQRVFRRHHSGDPWLCWWFAAAYGGIWLVFSLILAGIHWLLRPLPWPYGIGMTVFLFALAGLYQFCSWKQSCLRACRSPVAMLLTGWRNGRLGAVWMGVHHGLVCVGCCWALMLLMFGIGMMSFAGMLVITAMISLERVLPFPPRTISAVHGILLWIWAALFPLFQGGT